MNITGLYSPELRRGTFFNFRFFRAEARCRPILQAKYN